MRFEKLLSVVAKQPFFDLATLVQLSGEKRTTLRTQLSRWTSAGKLSPLRRGMYALAEPYRSEPINPAELANHLYHPSYLSREWALGFHGLIPEMVVTYTSVTTRVPRQFVNDFGSFEYRHIKQSAFFGVRAASIQGHKVMLATPEKALLDYWYLSTGPWSMMRMEAMRFQNGDSVDGVVLDQGAERFGSPALRRTVCVWHEYVDSQQQGIVEL